MSSETAKIDQSRERNNPLSHEKMRARYVHKTQTLLKFINQIISGSNYWNEVLPSDKITILKEHADSWFCAIAPYTHANVIFFNVDGITFEHPKIRNCHEMEQTKENTITTYDLDEWIKSSCNNPNNFPSLDTSVPFINNHPHTHRMDTNSENGRISA